jgi:tRNA pseudouridine55 synthase
MVMLVGRHFTRLSDQFLLKDKEYVAEVFLGKTTDTYDCEGEVVARSDLVPSLEDIQRALESFQGEILQIPPMFSAKKIQGKKLYELARSGKEIERAPVKVVVDTHFISYHYPYLHLRVRCSKGTYIRSIAYDLGVKLGCGAHLSNLVRTRSGTFNLENCLDGTVLLNPEIDVNGRLIQNWTSS